jgi:predicted nucleotidyltransferase
VTDFEGLLRVLHEAGVKFILVGGMAAIAHGAARVTYDLDVVYERSPQNLRRLAGALRPLKPRLRGAPEDVPFLWDEETLTRGSNFTLITTMGDLDILGYISGAGEYNELAPHTIAIQVEDVPCLCLDLDTLIHVKKAAGRKKDREALDELEALKEERDRQAKGDRQT